MWVHFNNHAAPMGASTGATHKVAHTLGEDRNEAMLRTSATKSALVAKTFTENPRYIQLDIISSCVRSASLATPPMPESIPRRRPQRCRIPTRQGSAQQQPDDFKPMPIVGKGVEELRLLDVRPEHTE